VTDFDLRDRLIAIHRRGDEPAFVDLCRHNADTIVRAFNAWTEAGLGDLMYDQRAAGAWLHAMVATAEVLRDMGHPAPLKLLLQDTLIPIYRWRHTLTLAQRLSIAGVHERAHAVLHQLLTEMRGLHAPVWEDLRLRILGLLGACSLQLGYFIEAAYCSEEALRRGALSGDRTDLTLNTETLDMATVGKEMAEGAPAAADLIHVRERICAAQDLSDTGRYTASNEVLRRLLTNDPDNRYLAKIHGLLGLNFHRLKDIPSAHRHTALALAKCRRANDPVGVTIYAANLHAIDSS